MDALEPTRRAWRHWYLAEGLPVGGWAAIALHLARASLLALTGFAATAVLWFVLSLPHPRFGSPLAAEIVVAVLFAMSEILNCGRLHEAGVLRRIIVTAGAFFGYLSAVALTGLLIFGPGPPTPRKGEERLHEPSGLSTLSFFLLWAGFVVLMCIVRVLWCRPLEQLPENDEGGVQP